MMGLIFVALLVGGLAYLGYKINQEANAPIRAEVANTLKNGEAAVNTAVSSAEVAVKKVEADVQKVV